MESVMRTAIFVSSIVALLAFSEAHGMTEGETVSGFQCVGINIQGLHLSEDDLRTGAKFPWIVDAPKDGAKAVRRISTIILKTAVGVDLRAWLLRVCDSRLR
jgi:hypothetical protein